MESQKETVRGPLRVALSRGEGAAGEEVCGRSCRVAVALGALGALAMGLSLATASCSSPALSAAEIDAVMTVEDEERDYSSYRTFAVATSFPELCGILNSDDRLDEDGVGGEGGRAGLDESNCYEVSHRADAEIRKTLREEMEGRGFTEVALDASPDLYVTAAHVARFRWYYAPEFVWCEPGLSYQCWYPDATYPHEFLAGALLLNVFDLAESERDDLKSVWFASLSGVYSEDPSAFAGRAATAIERAFAQSPRFAAEEQ